MKELIQHLLPGGEFVEFKDIRQGDNIARGGATSAGELLEETVAIGRAWRKHSYPDDDDIGTISSFWSVDDSGFGSDLAFTTREGDISPWFYRFNLDYPTPAAHEVTDAVWTKAVLDTACKASASREILVENSEIKSGMTLLIADITLDGKDGDGEFEVMVHLGVTDNHIPRLGWVARGTKFDGDRGFILVLDEAFGRGGWAALRIKN